MKLIFLGPPGAGKGTQAAIFAKQTAIPAISTGAILREAIAEAKVIDKETAEYISKGELAPDSVVINIVKARLSRPDCANGYILDGFPRNVEQAVALDDMLPDAIDLAVSIEVPDEMIFLRLNGRRECSVCAATYHVAFNPPVSENVCDRCGAGLSCRLDDEEETIENRIRVYHEKTEPIKEYYREKGRLICVDGAGDVKQVTENLQEVLEFRREG